MSADGIILGKVAMRADYWHTMKKYLHPKLQIRPEMTQISDILGFVRKNLDGAGDTASVWYLSEAHMRDMASIPARILIQNDIHTSLDPNAIKNAVTGYSDATEAELIRLGKESTITSAQAFCETTAKNGCNVNIPKGVLLIPYFMPAKGKNINDIIGMCDKYGMPNITIRTNNPKLKYVRTATNAYNAVEPKKVLTRMPYVPYACLTEETRYMALSMLLDDVVRKNRNIPDIKCAAAKELDRILAAEAKSVKRPIYIIEGEKKALSLYASCEAQYIQAISDAVSKRESGKVTPTPFDVVGISGVWQTLSGKNELQPDLTQCIDFSERDVVVIYDNDLMTNLQVVNALAAFANGLSLAGAKSVSMVYPHVPELCRGCENKCKGYDDTVAIMAEELRKNDAKDAMLRAHLTALSSLMENIVPIKTLGTQPKELKRLFSPYYTGKSAVNSAIAVIADQPQSFQPELA